MLGAKSEHGSTSGAWAGQLRHPCFDVCAIVGSKLVFPLEEGLRGHDAEMSESFQRGKIT